MCKKGISMVVLVIGIATILVLATVATTSYNVIIRSARMREFGGEINSLQKAVKEYKFMNGEYPQKGEYTLNLSDIDEKYRAEQFGKESGNIEFYKIDLQKLGIKEIARGLESDDEELDFYAISKENGNIYYLAGVKIGDKYYYTLIDELREKLDI